MFILLTEKETGKRHIVNSEHIIDIRDDGDFCTIVTNDAYGTETEISETFETLEKKLVL